MSLFIAHLSCVFSVEDVTVAEPLSRAPAVKSCYLNLPYGRDVDIQTLGAALAKRNLSTAQLFLLQNIPLPSCLNKAKT